MRHALESMQVMARPNHVGSGAMLLPSPAGDGVAKATWPWHDVDAESSLC
jgi:hypothetical protein